MLITACLTASGAPSCVTPPLPPMLITSAMHSYRPVGGEGAPSCVMPPPMVEEP